MSNDTPPTSIELLGRLRVTRHGLDLSDGVTGRVGQLAFAFLVLNRSRAIRRDELIEAIWETGAPKHPEAALRVVLSRVRSALGGDAVAGRAAVRLAFPEPVEVDVEQLERAVVEAELSKGRAEEWPASRLAAAELLPGIDASWLGPVRAHVDDLRARGLALIGDAELRRGAAGAHAARSAAGELLRLAPFREAGHRLMIEALVAQGERAEALRAFDRLRVTLREELGAAPGRELQKLHLRLLNGERAPAG
jgi:DNA-binding SARP family transcriptional activator